ncbi:hypothetical protein TNCV_2582131 [Trichonephila clavipes]|nr:hypothetical protein TNCV_2582131 [Trichonephila clavipes]
MHINQDSESKYEKCVRHETFELISNFQMLPKDFYEENYDVIRWWIMERLFIKQKQRENSSRIKIEKVRTEGGGYSGSSGGGVMIRTA